MNPANSSPFRQAEERYFTLRGQLDTGRITRAQFDEALAQLMLRDPQGRYWALGGDSGRWNVFQSGVWVEATPEGETPPALPSARPAPPIPGFSTAPPATTYSAPPPAPVYAAPPSPVPVYSPATRPPTRAEPQPAQGGGCGCGRTLGCGCLLLIVLLLACGGGGYWAYTNHIVTQATFLNLVGLGPARIEVDNFRDDGITVSFSQTDAGKDSTPIQGTLQLNAFDVKAFHTPNAAKFRIDFVTAAARANLGMCMLDVHSGDEFQFVALPDKIVVNRLNNPPKTGTDLIVSSSTLCR